MQHLVAISISSRKLNSSILKDPHIKEQSHFYLETNDNGDVHPIFHGMKKAALKGRISIKNQVNSCWTCLWGKKNKYRGIISGLYNGLKNMEIHSTLYINVKWEMEGGKMDNIMDISMEM